MLNSKELAKVLNANVHPKLFASWVVMSPNATLLAYSGKPNIKTLRDQATLLSEVWKDAGDSIRSKQGPNDMLSSSSSTSSTIVEGALETVTVETGSSNIFIRAIQPRLLLVLMGGPVPTRNHGPFKITPEARGDARYPSEDVDAPDEDRIDSSAPEESSDELAPQRTEELSEKDRLRMLSIQRKKIDAATEFMRNDFESKGFVMPEPSSLA